MFFNILYAKWRTGIACGALLLSSAADFAAPSWETLAVDFTASRDTGSMTMTPPPYT